MGGMNAFFSEALSLIPQDEILSLFFLKMEESADFSSFLEKLNPSDYENLAENLKVRTSKPGNAEVEDSKVFFSRRRDHRDSKQSTLNFTRMG